MTSLSHEDFSKVTVKSQLTLDSQCYLAPAQRAFCANYSLATTILTNFPEAVGRYLVNRILSTAQWEIISIKQVTPPDTSDLMDGWWQWKIISKCHWVVLPCLHSSDIGFLCTQPISQTGREHWSSDWYYLSPFASILTPPMHFITWSAALTLSEIHVCQQMQHMQLPVHSLHTFIKPQSKQ